MDIGKNLKAIIFDLDGTLFELSIDRSNLKQAIEKVTGRKLVNYEDELKGASEHRQAITKLVDNAELEGVANGHALSGVQDTVRSLQKKYRLAVVTRNGLAASKAALEKAGLDIDVLITRNDVENLKPHPEAIKLALSKLVLASQDTVVVGDTQHDVDAAHNAGMKSIIVENKQLKFVPNGADVYIKAMPELLSLLT